MTNKSLTIEETSDLLKTISNWRVNKNKLIKTFYFKNFVEAFAFMTKIAMIAESINHHPEWSNVYSDVTIKLRTHDLGGLSNLDVDFAKSINAISKKFSSSE